ncbi:UDP-4-amino-4,6-dideoxy-N-acetyl-beta-L-altrosamine transaminase [Malaciobacter halophilus]|nr:DegT/DnrJ/EryC1/StrS family aminotransferase [Malaciobacter halophilus]RYA23167.1 UDP-4-amino-4,6-dideoxy-N-acetyl-beta-L-altrosamine transaminase [Malaciobacter halophilus]
MRNKNILFHKTHIGQEEIDAVVEAMKSGWVTMGPKTIEFERVFSEYIFKNTDNQILLNTDFLHSVSCNSATAALHLALKAIGLKKDDEVILPTNTFIATAEVVGYFDAKPVLCDVEYDTHNIDCSKIEALITPKTKAIMPVHFAGQPCDMDKIIQIAKKHNIKIIEDAAHALPSKYKGQLVGQIGDITCFSFYATKTLSTGEGGMAVTKNPDFAKSMRINRLHGISRDAWDRYTSKGSWFYEVVDNGYKYNTTDLNSALGIVQLKKLEWMKEQREKIANRYNEAFEKIDHVVTPFIKEDRETSWHLYVIKVSNRNEFIENLKKEGVNASVHFIPVHKQPYYKNKYNYQDSDYPVANKVYEESVSLPIYPDLSEDDLEYIIEKVIKYAK